MAPTARSEASGSMTNGLLKSGNFNTGISHKTLRRVTKHFQCSAVYSQVRLELSKSGSGAAIAANFGINSCYNSLQVLQTGILL